MDLGLSVSQDTMHYREPIPDFKIVRCLEENPLMNPGPGAGAKTMRAGAANIPARCGPDRRNFPDPPAVSASGGCRPYR